MQIDLAPEIPGDREKRERSTKPPIPRSEDVMAKLCTLCRKAIGIREFHVVDDHYVHVACAAKKSL